MNKHEHYLGNHYAVEVETSTHELLKGGVFAQPRGPVGSRYRIDELSGLPWGAEKDVPKTELRTVLSGPDFTVVYVSAQEARNDREAILVACQMASCTSRSIPTVARLISWPTS